MRKGRIGAAAVAAVLLFAALSSAIFMLRPAGGQVRETVRIAIPYNKYVYQPNTNYYTLWLEEQTGLDIEFVLMEETVTDEYLERLFSTGAGQLDAIFLAPGQTLASGGAVLRELGRRGEILPLESYIEELGENTKDMFASFDTYDLAAALADENGHIYWLPNVSTAQHTQIAQTMWINVGWLKALGLQLPQTTAEFEQVMRAFATCDPNGNGLADEVPIAGCAGADAYKAYHFLINAFVYDDPRVAYLAMEQGKVSFSPVTKEWRDALGYLRELYEDELLPPECFTFTAQQLEQLVNDPRDLVGCFASESIADLVRTHSPDVLNRFVHLPPLKGPDGTGFAQAPAPQVYPGGLIFGRCENPRAVFRLMDLMLSPEAALIAHFGQQDVDWKYAAPGDVTITGRQALIHVRKNLSAGLQNQNLAQVGPCYLVSDAAGEVMWGGPLMEPLFMDGRAATAYEASYPAESIPALLFEPQRQDEMQEVSLAIKAYTDGELQAFVTGECDIGDDVAWRRYVARFDALGLPALLAEFGATGT